MKAKRGRDVTTAKQEKLLKHLDVLHPDWAQFAREELSADLVESYHSGDHHHSDANKSHKHAEYPNATAFTKKPGE